MHDIMECFICQSNESYIFFGYTHWLHCILTEVAYVIHTACIKPVKKNWWKITLLNIGLDVPWIKGVEAREQSSLSQLTVTCRSYRYSI